MVPRSLLFVCHGNICRSPYAEAATRAAFARLQHAPAVASGGLIGPDRPSPQEAVLAARERGLDLADHRSQLVTAASAAQADLVLVMDTAQRHTLHTMFRVPMSRLMLLGDLDPVAITTRAIPDPVEQPLDAFRSCYDRIDRCVSALAGALRGGAPRL